MASTQFLLGFCLFFGLVLLTCHAKPYHQRSTTREHIPSDEQDGSTDKKPHRVGLKKGKWMSWDPDMLIPDENFKEIPIPDPCENVWCHQGRVCQVTSKNRGVCVCGPPDLCNGHRKQVCGDDGIMYSSHCELHRMACIKDKHIGVDHTNNMCNPKLLLKESQVSSSSQEDDEEEEMQPTDDKPKMKDPLDMIQEQDTAPKEEKVLTTMQPTAMTRELQTERINHCTKKEFMEMKNKLLSFHCHRIGEEDCPTSDSGDFKNKPFLGNVMFTYYDGDLDGLLSEPELDAVEKKDHLDRLSTECHLRDLMVFDDGDKSKQISQDEFLKAFNVTKVLLDDDIKYTTIVTNIGKSLELQCDIRGAEHIIWKRNGADLSHIADDSISVLPDGILYIHDVNLEHMGNFTCEDRDEDQVVQTHTIRIQVPPKVRVAPIPHVYPTGATVTLRCHADGIPEPKIIWEKNEREIPSSQDGKIYLRERKNTTLLIQSANFSTDTGAYKCRGLNAAGEGQDISTVFITDASEKRLPTISSFERFVVFHDNGFTVYEPELCTTGHQVTWSYSYFKGPDGGIRTLCEAEHECSWGSAANIQNRYLYVTQPKLNRVIVISVQNGFNPVEVINSDKVPVSIHYIEHLDQVWALCWNTDENTGSKTLMVISDASKDTKHEAIHTKPVGNHFDLVKDVFLPPSDDLKHKFRHGYVAHFEQQALYKLDLSKMAYVKTIDLHSYNCIPKSVGFVSLGGFVLIQCDTPAGFEKRTLQLVMDYLTDTITAKTTVPGRPHVTPDAKYIVNVDTDIGAIAVQKMSDDGILTYSFDEFTNLHISDVAFFPSSSGQGYDFFATSVDQNNLMYINLDTGHVELIEGVGESIRPENWKWNHENRAIISSGVFGKYLMTPSGTSMIIVDGHRRHVQCELPDVSRGNVILWVEPISF
ncbi:follistatin-related protein 5-like isoform X2 [Lineus longissimus]|uniref:follistatin-related protein 5-like isoform X2 n=1 Tax=Lineus longissimus TaxID=88925 RepID=UPI002B4CA548